MAFNARQSFSIVNEAVAQFFVVLLGLALVVFSCELELRELPSELCELCAERPDMVVDFFDLAV